MEETKQAIDLLIAEKLERIVFATKEMETALREITKEKKC